MFIAENLSPIFSSKSKSSPVDVLPTSKSSSHDLIEHDVTSLAKMTHLPAPHAFEAIQIGSDRLELIINSITKRFSSISLDYER